MIGGASLLASKGTFGLTSYSSGWDSFFTHGLADRFFVRTERSPSLVCLFPHLLECSQDKESHTVVASVHFAVLFRCWTTKSFSVRKHKTGLQLRGKCRTRQRRSYSLWWGVAGGGCAAVCGPESFPRRPPAWHSHAWTCAWALCRAAANTSRCWLTSHKVSKLLSSQSGWWPACPGNCAEAGPPQRGCPAAVVCKPQLGKCWSETRCQWRQ